jgi:hypothetical protein
MTVTADASFLVSLYGVDVNTPAARLDGGQCPADLIDRSTAV